MPIVPQTRRDDIIHYSTNSLLSFTTWKVRVSLHVLIFPVDCFFFLEDLYPFIRRNTLLVRKNKSLSAVLLLMSVFVRQDSPFGRVWDYKPDPKVEGFDPRFDRYRPFAQNNLLFCFK